MSQHDLKPNKSWKVIAELLVREKDAQNLTRLANELIHALDEQTKHRGLPDFGRDGRTPV